MATTTANSDRRGMSLAKRTFILIFLLFYGWNLFQSSANIRQKMDAFSTIPLSNEGPMDTLYAEWERNHKHGKMTHAKVAKHQTGFFGLGLGKTYQGIVLLALVLGLYLETVTRNNTIAATRQSKAQGSFAWKYPVVAIKIFMASMLLYSDCIDVPERLVVDGIPQKKPELVYYMLPGIKQDEYLEDNDDNFGSHAQQVNHFRWYKGLAGARSCLFVCWLLYILLPISARNTQKLCRFTTSTMYVAGALVVAYFEILYVLYTASHRTQGPALFLLGSILAVPCFGGKNEKVSSVWLKRYLYLCILIPIYLSAGFCKLRYKGIISNFSGEWIGSMFKNRDLKKSTFPVINQYIIEHPWTWKLFSVGNMVIELILPLLTLLTLNNEAKFGSSARLSFHFMCLSFHATIYYLMNPSFSDFICMHVLAMEPLFYLDKLWQFLLKRIAFLSYGSARQRLLQHCGKSDKSQAEDTVTKLEGGSTSTIHGWHRKIQELAPGFLQQAMSWWTVCGFFMVHFKSDYLHIQDKIPKDKRWDPLFPFSTYPMYSNPTSRSNYYCSLALVCVTLACYLWFLRQSKWRW